MRTESKLFNIYISEGKITSIILSLNSKKAHGHDDISTTMLKLCAPVVAMPLNLIFSKYGNMPMSSLHIRKIMEK